jgi:soluble lytic murein transglycosylase
LGVIFPLGYWSLIRQYAATHHLDPYLLAALIAQESAFIPDIRSPAKATGLMQLMPATAQRYARKLAVAYSPAMVMRLDPNVRLGTAYFADLVRVLGMCI